MFIEPLALALALAAGARGAAAALPDAAELLRAGMRPPDAPYAGEVSVLTWSGRTTRARELLVRVAPPNRFRREVVDRHGATSQVIVSDGRTEWFYDRARRTVWTSPAVDPDDKMLGPEDEFDLLSENYAYAVAGEETVAGRRCWVVAIRARSDGRLVRSVWIDRRRRVVLQSKSFEPDGSASSMTRFVKIEFDRPADPSAFRFTPPLGARVIASRLTPDYLELEDARVASGVSPRHPAWLPGGYVFESLNVVPYAGATLLHYRYSDGIDALSLFQCPPGARLDFGDRPLEKVALGRAKARLSFGADGKVLEWAGLGQRFVLVGDLPLDDLRRVAESVR